MRRLKSSILAAVAGAALFLVACQNGERADLPALAEEGAVPTSAPAAPGPTTDAQTPAPASAQTTGAQTPPAPAAKPKFVAPIRGEAEIGYLKPATKVVKDMVVTTIKIRNMSNGAIAGLRVEEFWWDKANNPLPSDSQRLKKPLMPGEVATIELNTPRSAGMNRNSYKFSHANGTIKAKLLPKLE